MKIPACYERIEPTERRYECHLECPNCGAELHEGDRVYQMTKRKPTLRYVVFACEYCIDDMACYVEDL